MFYTMRKHRKYLSRKLNFIMVIGLTVQLPMIRSVFGRTIIGDRVALTEGG